MTLVIRGVSRYEESDMMRGQMTIAQFSALSYVREQGECPVHELSNALRLKFSSTSGLVDRMVRLGLVRRVRGRDDRRVVRLSVTAKAKAKLDEVVRERKKTLRVLFSGLTAYERSMYLRLLEKVAQGMLERDRACPQPPDGVKP